MSEQQHENHVVPIRVYLAIFAALIFFTGLTVWVAFQELGTPWNDVIALAIAATKGTLVVLYFMHVRYQTRFTALVVASGFGWLLILFAFTLGDYLTRGMIGFPGR